MKERTMKKPMLQITFYELRGLIDHYDSHATRTSSGGSTYELTLEALRELRIRRQEKALPEPSSDEEKLSELNERQMLMLYIASAKRRDLIDVGKAVNAKTAEQLVELGVMDSWLRVTDLGRKVLKS